MVSHGTSVWELLNAASDTHQEIIVAFEFAVLLNIMWHMSCDLNYRIRNIQVIKINGSTQVCPQRGAVLPLEDSHVTHNIFLQCF